ncbi:hypothetical protein C8R43DRAFT_939046 [Mycena crocata]|nr:hypothetical protein C8R43DRAFT_939046 [Mycena crocata]
MQPPLSAMALYDMNKASKPADTGDTDAGAPQKSPIVDLKNGKVIFKQKPISFEKHSETLQEIIRFREMLEERSARRADILTDIPAEYQPVVAKLAHESDKTLSVLAKHILQELLPVQDEDDDQNLPPPLTLPTVENGIKAVAARNNYGLDAVSGGKVPAALCAWRWEVKPTHFDWLPKSAREKAENRMAERAQARLDLKAIFDALPKAEQDSILDSKGTASGKASTKDGIAASLNIGTIDLTGDHVKSPPQQSKKKKANEENESAPTTKLTRPKKIVDSEKTAKEKEKQEKQEKKAAKAEREQKEKDAQNKSRSLMQSFFKGGNAPRCAPVKEAEAEDTGSSSTISHFQKTFKPFVVKKDTSLAPVNWFLKSRTGSHPLTYDGDVIVVDDGDEVQSPGPNIQSIDVTRMSAKDRLRTTLQSLPPPLQPHGAYHVTHSRSSITRLKTSTNLSVRDIIAKLSEAEVAGDDETVRRSLSNLADRDHLPAKVFIFADDARPGYFGTWTRNSRIIGPRVPFARDVDVFDYGYDSGEEWEEEPTGDADDVDDDGEDEDVHPDDADSDLDSWLVDDDELDTPASERGTSPVFTNSHAPAKRKAEADDSKLMKKRKVVVPLVPFAKGPCWEQTIGQCDHNILNPYRIQLFNDAPFPIDPFTFVSRGGDTKRTSKPDGFAVPMLPDRLVATTTVSQPDSSPTSHPAPGSKRSVLAPKTAFPEIHLAHLLDKIAASQIASLPILIDTIYQDLRNHNVKKNSIEAKVREVAEKCKVKRVWIVKENFRVVVQGA